MNGKQSAPELPERVLGIARNLARELHPQMPGIDELDADASLERQFGLDSLARAELLMRIERDCGAEISATALAESDTVRDLAAAAAATQKVAPGTPRVLRQLPEPSAIAPPAPRTLVEALEWHAACQSGRTHILLIDREADPEPITFGDLRGEAGAVAAGLARGGIRPGDTVAIMLPTGREFFAALYGTLLCGAIPVPLYPPARPSQLEGHLRRLAGIIDNCRARILVTTENARRFSPLLRSFAPQLERVAAVADVTVPGAAFSCEAIDASQTAFLQYTSGSTGQPKGVVLTHANLLANLAAMQRATGVTSADCFASWLPLYHDMGLIGACFGALVIGFPLVLMSPLSFLARPVRWLQAIQRHGATLTAAPNFAYEMCASKIADRDIAGLDLGSLRLAFNGAEAVSSHTLERFAERYAKYGLRRSALMPVYGLAEGALGLTFPPSGSGFRVDRIDREGFLRSGIARRTPLAEPRAIPIVSCGRPLPGHAVRIVDTHGTPLPERTQGRIEFQGPSATRGYFNNPDETRRLFDGQWLDTGDLGYLAEGELYVTGRAKDIIIRGGHNIHPQELEEAVGQLAEVRKGGVVVFPASDPVRGTERIVALVETRVSDTTARDALVARVNRLAVDLIGLPIDDVVLAPPRTILKTSSGKIRRAACREAYEHGKLGAAGRAPWLQLARLALAGVATRLRRAMTRLGAWAWGVRAWLVAAGFAPLLCIAILSTPGLRRRRACAAALARSALRLAGVKMRVESLAHGRGAHDVYVANHASYLDTLILMAVMPSDVTFVAKKELERSLLLGPLSRRLGCLFVERHETQEAIAAARSLVARLGKESVLVFAEGTFRRDPGVLPFHLGAFRAAASSGTRVIPVALAGTRAMLPDGAWLPRRAPIEISIGLPLQPHGTDWSAALELRGKSREFILAHVNEPDLEAADTPAR